MRYKGRSAILSSASSEKERKFSEAIKLQQVCWYDTVYREASSISKLLHYTTQRLCTAAEMKDRPVYLIVILIVDLSDLELDWNLESEHEPVT